MEQQRTYVLVNSVGELFAIPVEVFDRHRVPTDQVTAVQLRMKKWIGDSAGQGNRFPEAPIPAPFGPTILSVVGPIIF